MTSASEWLFTFDLDTLYFFRQISDADATFLCQRDPTFRLEHSKLCSSGQWLQRSINTTTLILFSINGQLVVQLGIYVPNNYHLYKIYTKCQTAALFPHIFVHGTKMHNRLELGLVLQPTRRWSPLLEKNYHPTWVFKYW